MAESVIVAGPENSGFRFSWGLAIAGGVVATAVTFFLLVLGSGFGLLLINPTADESGLEHRPACFDKLSMRGVFMP
ncbi:MAG TPA: hypothetical protein VHX61_17285 [Rhizomicrobium sp.]|jgi:hypothetical protein|nr:hypothetical protein [Rhizomicrobium sp.]